MKSKLITVILIITFLTGISLLLYPTVSDYWNSFHQSRAIAGYVEQVTEMETTNYDKILEEANNYNGRLLTKEDRYAFDDKNKQEYEDLLDISGTGIMGYVEIPKINTALPIYHGVDETVLQIAVGHIMGSSLPVGGEGTHCVISGHRGLPSVRLFTDLDLLKEGDVFLLHVLDEVLTYEIDRILTVLPHEMDAVEIEEGEDYCTLVTCTPYGVNSHRLLVRGHRIYPIEDGIRVSSDAIQIDPLWIAPFAAIPLFLLSLICVYISSERIALKRHNLEKLLGKRE